MAVVVVDAAVHFICEPRCANNELNDIVSELLCALLSRLTDLEQHEEDLRASFSPTTAELVSHYIEKRLNGNWMKDQDAYKTSLSTYC